MPSEAVIGHCKAAQFRKDVGTRCSAFNILFPLLKDGLFLVRKFADTQRRPKVIKNHGGRGQSSSEFHKIIDLKMVKPCVIGETSLSKAGYKVLGVSKDPAKSHLKFIDKFGLQFDLLCDEELHVHNAYGVWGLKKFMGREYDGTHRTTFVIDEQGVIEQVIAKPKTKAHAEEILQSEG